MWLWVYSGSSVKMMDDKLNLCLGSEGELWQSDLSWEWRVRVRRNWAPQGTRHWQIHPARRISEAFCFESWLLTSDPHPSSCQPLKDASPCQESSAPLILVIHLPDRPGPAPSPSRKESGWNVYSCTNSSADLEPSHSSCCLIVAGHWPACNCSPSWRSWWSTTICSETTSGCPGCHTSTPWRSTRTRYPFVLHFFCSLLSNGAGWSLYFIYNHKRKRF